MMKILIPFILLISAFFIACEEKSTYEQIVEEESKKEARSDSLFLGYSFGMDRKQFFDYSWELNQKQIVTGGTDVEFKPDYLKHKASMRFFPEFRNNRIYKMPVEYQYDGWAPWNEELQSDTLMADLVDVYRDKYEGDFIKMEHPENGKEAWINVNSNRRIAIYKKDEAIVRVEFLDLLAPDEFSSN
mgnify:CR=1 FL=1